MRPIVNMPQEDQATDTGSMHKTLVKIARAPEISWRTERQTDTQIDTLITILRNRARGRTNNLLRLRATYENKP